MELHVILFEFKLHELAAQLKNYNQFRLSVLGNRNQINRFSGKMLDRFSDYRF